MEREAIETDEVRTYTVTASLVAARLEDDDAIHLVIADPADQSLTMRVAFPSAAQIDGTRDRAVSERMRASREEFVDTFGLPSFEGFALLYGEARLTIAGIKPPADHDGTGSQAGARLYVLDFETLDTPAPRSYARGEERAPAYRPTAGVRVQEPWTRWATWS